MCTFIFPQPPFQETLNFYYTNSIALGYIPFRMLPSQGETPPP